MNFGLVGAFFFGLIISLSKELIVFNAETLVALCFFLFLYVLVVYLSDTVNKTLEERAKSIHKSFEGYFELEKQQLETLSQYYVRQLGFLINLEKLFVYLRKVHLLFLQDVSMDWRGFQLNYLRFLLGEFRSSESSFSGVIHGYYISRLYISNSHFVKILPTLSRRFPIAFYKHFFIRNLRKFSNPSI